VQLTVKTLNGEIQVEGFETEHPELAIFEKDAMRVCDGVKVGRWWTVSHIPTGKAVIEGLLTKDLALATVKMLRAMKIPFSSERMEPFELSMYQAAASIMADAYFDALNPTEKGMNENG
jgi:hypothetical protein